jgi:hypothetical protein
MLSPFGNALLHSVRPTVGISGGGAESRVLVETETNQSQKPAKKRADSPPSTAYRVGGVSERQTPNLKKTPLPG